MIFKNVLQCLKKQKTTFFTTCFRYVLDHFFYLIFLIFVLESVKYNINGDKQEYSKGITKPTNTFYIVFFWIICHLFRDLRNIIEIIINKRISRTSGGFRVIYDIFVHTLFFIACVIKVKSYKSENYSWDQTLCN